MTDVDEVTVNGALSEIDEQQDLNAASEVIIDGVELPEPVVESGATVVSARPVTVPSSTASSDKVCLCLLC